MIETKINKFKSRFGLGDMVYLITDGDKKVRVITGVKFTSMGILYYLSCGVEYSTHYECEITYDKPFLNY